MIPDRMVDRGLPFAAARIVVSSWIASESARACPCAPPTVVVPAAVAPGRRAPWKRAGNDRVQSGEKRRSAESAETRVN
jgi:hypothetical protein